MFWIIIILIVVISIIVGIIGNIGKGIDKTMDNQGLSEQDRHNVWAGLALWSMGWGKKK